VLQISDLRITFIKLVTEFVSVAFVTLDSLMAIKALFFHLLILFGELLPDGGYFRNVGPVPSAPTDVPCCLETRFPSWKKLTPLSHKNSVIGT
jgi:hypothetical protein